MASAGVSRNRLAVIIAEDTLAPLKGAIEEKGLRVEIMPVTTAPVVQGDYRVGRE